MVCPWTTRALQVFIGLLVSWPVAVERVTLHAPFHYGGIRGNITFHQEAPGANVTISIHLTSRSPEAQTLNWGIYKFPVLFDTKTPCTTTELGAAVHDLSRTHGPISIPSADGTIQTFTNSEISLKGIKTIWGKSLLVRSRDYDNDFRSCSNIIDHGHVKSVEATFTTSVAGKVIFRQGELGETTIFSNIFHIGEEYTPSTTHEWKILATDILDDQADNGRRSQRRCEYLQILFDPNNIEDTNCSSANHEECKIGDLTRKHGEMVVGSANTRYSKKFFVDANLPLAAVEGQRSLYLTIYEKGNPFRILSCAKMTPIKAKEVKAFFNSDGVKGFIRFSQRYSLDPTVVTVNLKNVRRRGEIYRVHEFPVPPRISKQEDLCSMINVGDVFNPFEVDSTLSPAPGLGTSDEYIVGDLSGKYGLLDDNAVLGFYVDLNLPLFGRHSVIGRSIIIYNASGDRWVCATIGYPSPTQTAMATFVYPVVGRIIFRQEVNNPWGETTIYGDLSYGDGSTNNTEGHRWDIHEREPGRDFYNWTKRCDSVGKDFNPFLVGSGRQYERHCHPDNPMRCQLGDLSGKSSRISIAGRKGLFRNKFFFTEILLPLTGPYKILGKALVIHDDQAPPHRGDRLACTGIRIRHPVRAYVRSWSVGTGIQTNFSGFLHFSQETGMDHTELKVDISGLNKLASGYHVHELSVPGGKEFPCTVDSVRDHFNPFSINVSLGPAPGVGSADQYEVGDLSGKFGVLEDEDSSRVTFQDSNLPLHGPHSVIGRSVVIHKKERNMRWVCGTVQAEYKREHTREVIAVASFHQEGASVHGFIRMRQLEYADGGRGDTWLEVDLRYPGKHNRNVTQGHKWAVYVNQVGHDAVERVEKVRCIASGYLWNPYLVKSDDDYYRSDCGAHNPFRCEMGDLSGRHGLLTIGSGRKIFTDVNLPLVGNYSVMGRSIIIFGKDGSEIKLACANIKPDIHLVQQVAVKTHPGFSSAKFMEDMRDSLNTTDWLVVEDVQARRESTDKQCNQMTVHFYGPEAHRLQVEFSNLINLGSVRRETRLGPRFVKTFYKPCGKAERSNGNAISRSLVAVVLWLGIFLMIES